MMPKKKDLKRVDRITDMIKKIWKANPSLRLCQLIGNCFPPEDLYYKEDHELEKQLKRIYKRWL